MGLQSYPIKPFHQTVMKLCNQYTAVLFKNGLFNTLHFSFITVYRVTVWIPTTSAQSDHLQQDSHIKHIGGREGWNFF